MPADVKMSKEQLAILRQNLVDHFSEDELRTLCYDVGVDYEGLPAEDKTGKVRELVIDLERRKSIPDLVRMCYKLRPNISWDTLLNSTQETIDLESNQQRAGYRRRVNLRYRWFALVIIVCVIVVALVWYTKPFNPPSHLKAGQAALERGDTTTAIRELEAVIAGEPKQVDARVLLGRAYEKAGRRDDAINQYQAAVALETQDAQATFYLGALLVNTGKPSDAVLPFATGVKLNANMAVSYTKEISAAVSAGLAASGELAGKNPQQAAQLLDAVIKLDPRNTRARVQLGNLYMTSGQPQAALDQYKAALDLDPKNISAMTNTGAAYYQLGKLDDAIAQFQSALKLEPNDAETHYLLGAAYIQKSQVLEARAEFEAAVKSNPNLAAAYIGLGNVQMMQNDLEGAETSLNKAIQLAPNQPEALYALGKVLMTKGDQAGARQTFQRFLALNPPAARRAEVEEWLKQLGQ